MAKKKMAVLMIAVIAISATVLSGCASSEEAVSTDSSKAHTVAKIETIGYASEGSKEDAKESVSAEESTQDLQSTATSESSSSSTSVNSSASSSSTSSSSGSSGSSSTSSSSSSSGGTSGGSGSSSAPSAPSAPVHQHSWTYHDTVTEQVWISNYVYIPRYTCGHCGLNTYTPEEATAHQEAKALETGTCYAYYSSGYHEDQGHYETRTVSSAYHSCSCGARK